ncbi:hypothetical protein HY061_03090 [Candidatus Azambacteria bacterium]|nr:hypothetical protein [Candidatus Azambacteria bacterium]
MDYFWTSNEMNKNLVLGMGVVVALVVGFIAGSSYGNKQGNKTGYKVGYDKAIADAKVTQGVLAKKASESAASTANPFKVTNPLDGVQANPFEEAAKKLNPFAK